MIRAYFHAQIESKCDKLVVLRTTCNNNDEFAIDWKEIEESASLFRHTFCSQLKDRLVGQLSQKCVSLKLGFFCHSNVMILIDTYLAGSIDVGNFMCAPETLGRFA